MCTDSLHKKYKEIYKIYAIINIKKHKITNNNLDIR